MTNFSPLSQRLSQRVRNPLTIAILTLATIAISSGTASADEEKDAAHTRYRQSVMSAVGANMGSISTILKNGMAFPGHIENHAAQLAENAKLVAAAFKHQATGDMSDAKPKIWSDWSGFEEAIADFEEASVILQTAAASGDGKAMGPAVKQLGKSCGGCHKAYRKPKEESYKNN